MLKYICDRCGKALLNSPQSVFKVTIEPPEVWDWDDRLVTYTYGEMHFCTDCMKKINECIDELGRHE